MKCLFVVHHSEPWEPGPSVMLHERHTGVSHGFLSPMWLASLFTETRRQERLVCIPISLCGSIRTLQIWDLENVSGSYKGDTIWYLRYSWVNLCQKGDTKCKDESSDLALCSKSKVNEVSCCFWNQNVVVVSSKSSGISLGVLDPGVWTGLEMERKIFLYLVVWKFKVLMFTITDF